MSVYGAVRSRVVGSPSNASNLSGDSAGWLGHEHHHHQHYHSGWERGFGASQWPPAHSTPTPAQSRGSGRSAGSMCWCIVEAVLSTIVFGYTVKVDVLNVLSVNVRALFGYLAVAGYAVWTGASCYLCTSRVDAAVNDVKAVNTRESSSMRCDGSAASVGLGGMDLFEYHDIASMSSNMIQLAFVWLLFRGPVCIALSIIALLASLFTCQEWAWFSCNSYSIFFAPLVFVFSALYLGYLARFLYTSGVVDKIWNLGKPCQNQPFSFKHCTAWTLISVGSLVYTVFMFTSSAPSVLCWGVVLTHAARTLRVLYSLYAFGHTKWRSEPWSPDEHTVRQDKMC